MNASSAFLYKLNIKKKIEVKMSGLGKIVVWEMMLIFILAKTLFEQKVI